MDVKNEIDPVAAFEALTLESIDSAIESITKEIEEWLDPRNRRLKSLYACRKAVEIREQGARPRGKRGTKKNITKQPQPQPQQNSHSADRDDADESSTSEIPSIDKILTFLRVNGTIKIRSLAEHFGISESDEFRKVLQDTRYFKIDSWGRVNVRR